MGAVVDSSVWVDLLRGASPSANRTQAREIIAAADALLCEPIIFELLSPVPKRDRQRVEAILATFPVLTTPANLWNAARMLGQTCTDAGLRVGSMDLLIAAVCIHHGVPLATFDADFQQIAKVSQLRLQFAPRAR
jgi:predicted nucleic acid-binding protein